MEIGTVLPRLVTVDWNRLAAGVAGGLCVFLGLALGLRGLGQWPIAAGFVLCGSGLLFLAYGRIRLATVSALAAALAGFLVAAGYFRMGGIGHTGPLNAAICLLLAAVDLAFCTRSIGRQRFFKRGLLASWVMAFGMTVFLGYLTGIAQSYGWGKVIQMDRFTSLGFVILGAGLLAFCWRKENKLLPSAVILSCGIMLSIQIFHTLSFMREESLRQSFEEQASERTSIFVRTLESDLELVRALHAFYDSTYRVERYEFHEFTKTLFTAHPNVEAFEWIPRVPAKERARYEETARQEVSLGFEFKEFLPPDGGWVKAQDRSEYFPVYYGESGEVAESALGFDYASHPLMRETLERARDRGQMLITPPFSFTQGEIVRSNVFLAFEPVYEKGEKVESLEWRRNNLVGFVLGIFRVSDILEHALRALVPAGIDIYVWDQLAPRGERLIRFREPGLRNAAGNFLSEDELSRLSGLYYMEAIEVAGRKWLVIGVPVAEIWKQKIGWAQWVALAVSLFFTFFLAFFVWTQIHRAALVEKEVEEKTRELRASTQVTQMMFEEAREAQKAAEAANKALAESQRRSRLVIETANDAFIAMDARGLITDWNRRAETIFGWKREEVVGKSLSEVIIPPQLRESHREEMKRFFSTGEQRVLNKPLEVPALHKAGNEFFVELTIWALEENGNTSFNAFLRDISERKKAETELKRANQELKEDEEKLRGYLKELESAHGELQSMQSQLVEAAKIATVAQLSVGVAHEVKNPLQIFQFGLEYIAKNANLEQPDLQSVIKGMFEAIGRANFIIRELMELGRPGALELEPVNLNDVIRSSVSLLKNIFDTHHIRVLMSLTEDLPWVSVDRRRVSQIFINLLNNALEAMEGTGIIEIETTIQKAKIGDPGVGKRKEDPFLPGAVLVIAQITDSGRGIPEDILPKIYDPFFTTRRGSGGTGLGLSMVKNLVDVHGGAIAIKNKTHGQGTQATVFFRAFPLKKGVYTHG